MTLGNQMSLLHKLLEYCVLTDQSDVCRGVCRYFLAAWSFTGDLIKGNTVDSVMALLKTEG